MILGDVMNEQRVGLLIPSSNTVMEIDFQRGLPPEVGLHTARMFMEETTPEAEARMLDEFAVPAATAVATARPDLIVFGCTSAGALRGNKYDTEFCGHMEQETGVEVVSVIAAVASAIRRRGARRIGVVTPYVQALNNKITESLEDVGDINVVAIAGMGVTENFAIAEIELTTIIEFAEKTFSGHDIDLAFASCTNLHGIAARRDLEAALGVPVVTSNHAALEETLLRLTRIRSDEASAGEAA
jgi:maleate isomerase